MLRLNEKTEKDKVETETFSCGGYCAAGNASFRRIIIHKLKLFL